MQHFQVLKLFLLYVHVKWLVLAVVGLEIVAVTSIKPRFMFGSTVEIVSYVC